MRNVINYGVGGSGGAFVPEKIEFTLPTNGKANTLYVDKAQKKMLIWKDGAFVPLAEDAYGFADKDATAVGAFKKDTFYYSKTEDALYYVGKDDKIKRVGGDVALLTEALLKDKTDSSKGAVTSELLWLRDQFFKVTIDDILKTPHSTDNKHISGETVFKATNALIEKRTAVIYEPADTYAKDQRVIDGGFIYKALADGATGDINDTTKWTKESKDSEVFDGKTVALVYDQSKKYEKFQRVLSDGIVYKALVDDATGDISDATKWEREAPAFDTKTVAIVYDDTKKHAKDQRVIEDGVVYVALVDDATGDITDEAVWKKETKEFDKKTVAIVYDITKKHAKNQRVLDDGKIYVALKDDATGDLTNTATWKLETVISDFKREGTYSNSNPLFSLGDYDFKKYLENTNASLVEDQNSFGKNAIKTIGVAGDITTDTLYPFDPRREMRVVARVRHTGAGRRKFNLGLSLYDKDGALIQTVYASEHDPVSLQTQATDTIWLETDWSFKKGIHFQKKNDANFLEAENVYLNEIAVADRSKVAFYRPVLNAMADAQAGEECYIFQLGVEERREKDTFVESYIPNLVRQLGALSGIKNTQNLGIVRDPKNSGDIAYDMSGKEWYALKKKSIGATLSWIDVSCAWNEKTELHITKGDLAINAKTGAEVAGDTNFIIYAEDANGKKWQSVVGSGRDEGHIDFFIAESNPADSAHLKPKVFVSKESGVKSILKDSLNMKVNSASKYTFIFPKEAIKVKVAFFADTVTAAKSDAEMAITLSDFKVIPSHLSIPTTEGGLKFYETYNDIPQDDFKEGDIVFIRTYSNYHHAGFWKKDNTGFKEYHLVSKSIPADATKDYWGIKEEADLTENEKVKFEHKRTHSYKDLKEWNERHMAEGRWGKPVENIAKLKELKPKNDEHRRVDRDNYIFIEAGKLTPDEIADPLNVTPDAPNNALGKWIRSPIGALVDSDALLGNIVHSLPDAARALYEINGQTVKDIKLAAWLKANPIAGFTVNNDDIALPDWRGRYMGASGGRGIPSEAGALMSSSNKRHRHSVRVGDNANGTQRAQIHYSEHDNGNKYRNTEYEGSSYARPETVGIPFCIVGGRKIKMKVANPDLVPLEDVPKDEIHTTDIRGDSVRTNVVFAQEPAELKIGIRVWDGHMIYQSLSYSQIKEETFINCTARGMNDGNNEHEDFGIQYQVAYVSDKEVGITVTKAGYLTADNNWAQRTNADYRIEKVVAVYKAKKTIVKLDPNVTLAKKVIATFAGLTADNGKTSKDIYEGTTTYISRVDLSPNKMLAEEACTNCSVVDAEKGTIAYQREINGGNFTINLVEKDKLINGYDFQLICDNQHNYDNVKFPFEYTAGMKHIVSVGCTVHTNSAGTVAMKVYLDGENTALKQVHYWSHNIESGRHAMRGTKFELPNDLASGTYTIELGPQSGTWVYNEDSAFITVEKF